MARGHRYLLRARCRQSAGGNDETYLGVKAYGGPEKSNHPVHPGAFEQVALAFETGPQNTEAIVYFYKPRGSLSSWVDDVELLSSSGNLVTNPGFEEASWSGYSSDATAPGAVRFSPSRGANGMFSVLLTGISQIEQRITGLTPQTSYQFAVKVLNNSGGTAQLGVRSVGGLETSPIVASMSGAFEAVSVPFATGHDETEATIFVRRNSPNGGSYVDDLEVSAVSLVDRNWTGATVSIQSTPPVVDFRYGNGISIMKHEVPSKLGEYGGLKLGFDLLKLDGTADQTAAANLTFFLRFCYTAECQIGGANDASWYIRLRPDYRLASSTDMDIADVFTGGYPWTDGITRRPTSGLDHIELVLDDSESPGKVPPGLLHLRKFELQSIDAGNRAMDRSTDLVEIGKMDSAQGWLGVAPAHLLVDAGGLAVTLDLAAGEHLRLERNLVRGIIAHAGTIVQRDLKDRRVIRFRWRAEPPSKVTASFRIRDSHGDDGNVVPTEGSPIHSGWREWVVTPPSQAWQWVNLDVGPDDAHLDLARISGFLWEFEAAADAYKGKVWIDDLTFLTDAEAQAAGITTASRLSFTRQTPITKFTASTFASPVKTWRDTISLNRVHMILNASPGSSIVAKRLEVCGDRETTDSCTAVALAKDVNTAMENLNQQMNTIPGMEFSFEPFWVGGPKASEVKQGGLVETALRLLFQAPSSPKVYLQVAGPGGVAIEPAMAKRICEAWGANCLGYYMAEANLLNLTTLTQAQEMLAFLRTKGLKMIYHRYTHSWWEYEQFDRATYLSPIFSYENRNTLVPLGEILEPMTPGLNLDGRLRGPEALSHAADKTGPRCSCKRQQPGASRRTS